MPYSMTFVDYITFYTLYLLFTHDLFSEIICTLLLFECWWLCDFQVSWNIFFFYSLLEGFCTNFQDYQKTSCVIFHFGRVFQKCKIYFQSYFWKSLPNKGGWMGDHTLYAQIENYFNMCMNRVVFMSYTLAVSYTHLTLPTIYSV